MKGYLVWIVALVAVVAGVGVFRSPHPTEPPKTADTGSSWTLFAGIGSSGSDQKALKPATEFSMPVVRRYWGGSIDLENLTVVKFVEKYRLAATHAENPSAAYRVYLAEAMCAGIPARAAKQRLLEVKKRGPADEAAYMQALRDEVEACVGVTPALMDERYQFLKRAAQGGIAEAAIRFASEGPPRAVGDPIPPEWTADAIKFLQPLAERGYGDAPHRLALFYLHSEPPDRQKALTYEAVRVLLTSDRTVKDRYDVDPRFSEGLSPDQIAAALQDGNAIAARCGCKHDQ